MGVVKVKEDKGISLSPTETHCTTHMVHEKHAIDLGASQFNKIPDG